MDEHDPDFDDAFDGEGDDWFTADSPAPSTHVVRVREPEPPEPEPEAVRPVISATARRPPTSTGPCTFVPLVDQYIEGEIYRRKAEVFRLTPSRDAKNRPILRETPLLRVPLSWTTHELLEHEAVGPGQYRVRVRNGDGAFITHRDYDWRRDDETRDDEGVEVIGRRRRRVEPPDSPPATAPSPTPDLLQVIADARAEREAALAKQSEDFRAQFAAMKASADARIAAAEARVDEKVGGLEAENRRLTGEVNRLGGELAKAEKQLFEERMERRLAEARLEMRPATPSAPVAPATQQTLAEMVGAYRRQKAEFEAIQAELGGLGGASEAAEDTEPTDIDAAVMLPRVMEHFGKLSEMFGQFERLSEKFGGLL